jgi:hypothetical protein
MSITLIGGSPGIDAASLGVEITTGALSRTWRGKPDPRKCRCRDARSVSSRRP